MQKITLNGKLYTDNGAMTNVHGYMFKTLLSSCADSASGVARMGRGRSAFPLNFGKAVEPYFDFFDW